MPRGDETTADEMPTLRRVVRCRSMPAVWSAPDERRDWRPIGRGTARPGAFAEVILVFHPRRRYRVAESRDFASGAWSETGRIVASLALLRAVPLIARSAQTVPVLASYRVKTVICERRWAPAMEGRPLPPGLALQTRSRNDSLNRTATASQTKLRFEPVVPHSDRLASSIGRLEANGH